jgi:hypothetical protein
MDLKKIIIGFIGKKVKKALRDGKTEEQWEVSKAKITAVVTVLITAVQVLGPAFGYPVEIPNEVYQLLAAIGVWALRDGMPDKERPTRSSTGSGVAGARN